MGLCHSNVEPEPAKPEPAEPEPGPTRVHTLPVDAALDKWSVKEWKHARTCPEAVLNRLYPGLISRLQEGHPQALRNTLDVVSNTVETLLVDYPVAPPARSVVFDTLVMVIRRHGLQPEAVYVHPDVDQAVRESDIQPFL